MNQVAAGFRSCRRIRILVLARLWFVFCVLRLLVCILLRLLVFLRLGLILAWGIAGLRIWRITRRWLLLRLPGIVSFRPGLLLVLAAITPCRLRQQCALQQQAEHQE